MTDAPTTNPDRPLARNAMTYAQWAVVREAASIAQAGDVPLDRLLAVLEQAVVRARMRAVYSGALIGGTAGHGHS